MQLFDKENSVTLLLAVILSLFLSLKLQATPPPPINAENAVYMGIYKEEITLKEGLWEGKPFVEGGSSHPTIKLIKDFGISGDLNNNGKSEQVVFLTENSGGSGVQNYISVLGFESDNLSNIATALIGDRIQLQAVRIENNIIEVDVIQSADDDPICCPSQKATLSWSLEGDKLKQGKTRLNGKISLKDIQGPEWVLSQIKRGEHLASEQEITLKLEGEKLSGKSACNNYFSEIKETNDLAGNIKIGPIGSTRMACPDKDMKLELAYLKALEGVSSFSFISGKLALNWAHENSGGNMLFKSRKTKSK